MTYTDLDRPVRQEFALDGSETVNTVPTRRGQWQERSLARWEGAKLMIVTKLPSNVLTRTLSLVSGVLVMDIVLTVQAGTPMVSTIRYTKGGAR